MGKNQKVTKITENDIANYYEKSTFIVKLIDVIKQLIIPLLLVFVITFVSSFISYFVYFVNGLNLIIKKQNIDNYAYNDEFKVVTISVVFVISIFTLLYYAKRNIPNLNLKMFQVNSHYNIIDYIYISVITIACISFIILNYVKPDLLGSTQQINFNLYNVLLFLNNVIFSTIMMGLLRVTYNEILNKICDNFWILYIITTLLCIPFIIGQVWYLTLISIISQLFINYLYAYNKSIIKCLMYDFLNFWLITSFKDLNSLFMILGILLIIILLIIKIMVKKREINGKHK